jgi:hypothetical protein
MLPLLLFGTIILIAIEPSHPTSETPPSMSGCSCCSADTQTNNLGHHILQDQAERQGVTTPSFDGEADTWAGRQLEIFLMISLMTRKKEQVPL